MSRYSDAVYKIEKSLEDLKKLYADPPPIPNNTLVWNIVNSAKLVAMAHDQGALKDYHIKRLVDKVKEYDESIERSMGVGTSYGAKPLF